jgi:hypothetical protein
MRSVSGRRRSVDHARLRAGARIVGSVPKVSVSPWPPSPPRCRRTIDWVETQRLADDAATLNDNNEV